MIHILEKDKDTILPMQDLSWLVSHASRVLPGGYVFCDDSYYGNYYWYSVLISFNEDGNVVRRTIYLVHEETDFPFYSGSVEEETLSQLIDRYEWTVGNTTRTSGRFILSTKNLRKPSCRSLIWSG